MIRLDDIFIPQKRFENLIDIQFFPQFNGSNQLTTLIHNSVYTIKEVVEEIADSGKANTFKRFAKNTFGFFWKRRYNINRRVFTFDYTELMLLLKKEIASLRSVINHYDKNREIKVYVLVWLNSLYRYLSQKYPSTYDFDDFEQLRLFLADFSYNLKDFAIFKRDKVKIRHLQAPVVEPTVSAFDKLFKGLAVSSIVVYFFIKGK